MGVDEDEILAYRHRKDHWMRESAESPLPASLRGRFRGLSYYPPDPAYRFRVPLRPHAEPPVLHLPTSDGAAKHYENVGEFEVTLAGAPVKVQAYRAHGQEGLFVPFRDKTSGKETYGAGRYLDLEPGEDGTYVLDFNRAYNPSCAYDEAFSCPLPPPENWLQVPVRAGERTFEPG